MPLPPLLTLNGFGSLPLQVHELIGGTSPTQIGLNLAGTNQVFVPNVGYKGNSNGYVKTFKGERYCLTLSTTTVEVRRENQGGAGVWGVVYGFTNLVSTATPEYLMQIVKDGADVALVVVFIRLAAPHVIMGKSNDGAAWTETPFTLGYFARMTSTSVVFRNKVYFCDAASAPTPTKVLELDATAASLTTITAPWAGDGVPRHCSSDLCVAFDKLFCAAVDTPGLANGVLTLYEFTGGGWSSNSQIGATLGHNSGGDGQAGKYCLWTDNTNLYVVGYTEKDDLNTAAKLGSSVWRGVPSGSTFTWSQNDTTMVTGLRPDARGIVTAARQDRWSIYVDNDSDPANPAYYLIVAEGVAPGTGYAVYRWEGFGVEMGSGSTTGEVGPGASVSTAYALPENKHGGAEAISQGVASYGEIETETSIVGGYRLSYRVPGTQSGLTGRAYFSLEQGPPDTLATIVGGGTTFGPITGDNRAVLKTVDIDLGLSGIAGPDASNWMIELS